MIKCKDKIHIWSNVKIKYKMCIRVQLGACSANLPTGKLQ